VNYDQDESSNQVNHFCVNYEDIKRDLNRILINECRCDERPRGKTEGSTHLGYTGLRGGLEHLKIETRLRDERWGRCTVLPIIVGYETIVDVTED